ncbi:hypothetical protein EC968_008258 [Mortierella alpina]|nr:hypothetical protein EC968_008258 [Mortierella alpina]
MTAPFDQYDKVDMHVVDDTNPSRHNLLQAEVDLNIGVMAIRLEAILFPEDLPIKRLCHIVLTGVGNSLDGTHRTLNSSSFYMIRSGAMVIALVALGLLYRTRRRFKGNTGGHFKSLHDHPNSPTDGASKSSIYKSEGGQDLGVAEAPFLGPTFGGALAGRNSSNTARSAEPMMKGAPGMLGYNNETLPSSSPPLPLLERKSSTLYHVPDSASDAAAAAAAVAGAGAGAGTKEAKGDAAAGGVDRQGRPVKEPVLSAGDAQLIAETFRKSMRKPRWEDEDDEEEEERDEARRAAKELLRKELSEEGVDVQRGVQRRVTIRDRPHRSSLSPPVSQSVAMPEP